MLVVCTHTHRGKHRLVLIHPRVFPQAGDPYLAIGGCSRSGLKGLQLGGNVVYAPSANVTVDCGEKLSGADWLKLGMDKGTVIKDSSELSSTDIVAIGLAVLAH